MGDIYIRMVVFVVTMLFLVFSGVLAIVLKFMFGNIEIAIDNMFKDVDTLIDNEMYLITSYEDFVEKWKKFEVYDDVCIDDGQSQKLRCLKYEKDGIVAGIDIAENLYKNIFQEFDNKNILNKNSIVNELYKDEDASQSQYLIKTFSNKLWKELDEETIVNFLNGLDFYYLSNEAYFFILPACIRYGLEKFEDNEQLDYLTFFLSDKERVKNANEKIKILVVSYLNLLKKLNFLGFFEKEEKECLDLWK